METKRFCLLIVDDEEAHVNAIRRAYAAAGVDVEIQSAGTLREFRACVKARCPDLVLMDLNLPDGRAIEALTQPPEAAPFPILVMTTFGSQQTVVEVMKGGALDFVVKSPEAFVAMPHTVERAMREWDVRQQHKQAEALLQDREQRHRSIIQTAADGFFLADMQGRLLDVNTAYAQMSGYGVEELLTMRISDLDADETAEQFSTRIQTIMAKGKASFETRHRSKDGSLHDISSSVRYRPEDGGQLVVFMRDITERNLAERYREITRETLQILNETEAVHDSMQRIIGVLKTGTGVDAVGIRLQDGNDFPYLACKGFSDEFLLTENTLHGHDADGGVCRYENRDICLECICGLVISGKTDPALPLFTRGGSFWTNDSQTLLDLPSGQDPRYHPRNTCIHQGYASVALIPIRNKDRIVGLIHLNDHRKGCFTLGTIELLEGIASHLGEALMRKQAEQEMVKSNNLLTNLARLVPGVVYQYRLYPDGRSAFPYASPGINDIYEVTPEQVREDAAPVFGRIHPEDAERVSAAIAESARTLQTFYCEFRVILPRQGLRWHWSQAQPTRMEDGGTLWHGIISDVTERKQAEAEHLKIQTLQSIGTLAGGIAHDFNNIMQGVFGNISFALEDISKDHPAYESLKEAEKSMKRAVRLTRQLLTFSKGGAPIKEDINLGEMIDEVARFDLSGSNVALIFREADNLLPVFADKGQIQQIVSNLVINARQAMPNGGHLHISLENAGLPAEADASLRRGNYVKVSVQDDGIGIDPKVIDHIFDPYFTTKQTGSGLGLATVYSIIHKHDGHIGVVSAPGKGATFTFYLPASVAPLPVEAQSPAAECRPKCKPAKILIMDDEQMICELARRMLEHFGYSVETATSGQETITQYAQALESGAPFDAVVMDLTIPGGIGGKEAIKDLLSLDPNIRAIVSSGYAEDPVMADPAAYGFKDTIAKPYTGNDLREVVARVLT